MKIAVLISGTFPDYLPISTLGHTLYSTQRAFREVSKLHKVDFYYHTWDNEQGRNIISTGMVNEKDIYFSRESNTRYLSYRNPRLKEHIVWQGTWVPAPGTPFRAEDDSDYGRTRHLQHEAFAHLVNHLKEKSLYDQYDIIVRSRWDTWYSVLSGNVLNNLIYQCKKDNVVIGCQLFVAKPDEENTTKHAFFHYVLNTWPGMPTENSLFRKALFDMCILMKPQWFNSDKALDKIYRQDLFPDHLGWWEELTNGGRRNYINYNGVCSIPKILLGEDLLLKKFKEAKMYK